MRIQNNLMANNTHRRYGINNGKVAKSAEKLSSGYKINRAGDDAAGLAISEKMRAQIRGLNMASKNSQDAISLVQTAEGALQQASEILQRINELSVQAASDTNTPFDRECIQLEIRQLTKEIDSIGETKFNDMPIFVGRDIPLLDNTGKPVIPGHIPIDDFSIFDVNLANGPFNTTSSPDHLQLRAIVTNTESPLNGTSYNLIYGSGSTSTSSVRVTFDDGTQKEINLQEFTVSDFSVDADTKTYSRTMTYDGMGAGKIVEVVQSVQVDETDVDNKFYNISYAFQTGYEIADLEFMFHADTAYNNNDRCEGYYINGTRVDKCSIYSETVSALTDGKTNPNLTTGSVPDSFSIVDEEKALAFSEKIAFAADVQGTGSAPSIMKLDLSNLGGPLTITETGYSVNGGAETAHTGPYELTGTTGQAITISGGTQDIILNNASLTGSEIHSGYGALVIDGNAEVNFWLKDGSVNNFATNHNPIYVSSGSKLTVNGNGELNVEGLGSFSAGICVGTGAEIEINSGTISVQGGYFGAGIGGVNGSDGGRITINGGNITAIGGIGSAGIGGGQYGGGGDITITGGTVTAIGGNYSDNGSAVVPDDRYHGAAGIGGGAIGEGGNITITGGTVTATGGSFTIIGDETLVQDNIPGGPGIGGRSGVHSGSFSTGTNGNATITATGGTGFVQTGTTGDATGAAISDSDDTSDWSGWINGTEYGTPVADDSPGTTGSDNTFLFGGDGTVLGKPDSLSIGYYYEIHDWDYYDTLNSLGGNAINADLGFSLYYNLDPQGAMGVSFHYGIANTDTDPNIDGIPIQRDDDPVMIHEGFRNWWIQSGAESGVGLELKIDEMNAAVLGVEKLDVTTRAGATKAIEASRTAINTVSSHRARLGAYHNRLEHKISNLDNTSENLAASESRIRDVDMAKEMTEFTKQNILIQASISILGQANAAPQNVLSLLQ